MYKNIHNITICIENICIKQFICDIYDILNKNEGIMILTIY